MMYLVKTGVTNPVKQYEYVNTVFIITKRKGNVSFITKFIEKNQQPIRNIY